jgi:hypothetical protein
MQQSSRPVREWCLPLLAALAPNNNRIHVEVDVLDLDAQKHIKPDAAVGE